MTRMHAFIIVLVAVTFSEFFDLLPLTSGADVVFGAFLGLGAHYFWNREMSKSKETK